MRKVLMTAALVTMLALPVLAQFRGGFGRPGPDAILQNKSVQEELKLDDKQKKSLKEIAAKGKENREKAMEYFKDGDKDKGKEVMTKSSEETNKALAKLREGLTSTQAKRLTEIEVQLATKRTNPHIFKNPSIEKVLKLKDDQKKAIKETLSDLEKDAKEVREEGGKDFRKMGEKIQKLNKDAYTKITKSLTEDQAKVWKDAGGEKFDYKEENPFGKRNGKGGKKGKKDKDDL